MKVGDLVQYIRDMPTSFVEFQNGVRQNDIGLITDALANGTTVRVKWLKQNDIGLITDALANGTTVRVKWLKSNDEFWMGKNHLEVISGKQETKSS